MSTGLLINEQVWSPTEHTCEVPIESDQSQSIMHLSAVIPSFDLSLEPRWRQPWGPCHLHSLMLMERRSLLQACVVVFVLMSSTLHDNSISCILSINEPTHCCFQIWLLLPICPCALMWVPMGWHRLTSPLQVYNCLWVHTGSLYFPIPLLHFPLLYSNWNFEKLVPACQFPGVGIGCIGSGFLCIVKLINFFVFCDRWFWRSSLSFVEFQYVLIQNLLFCKIIISFVVLVLMWFWLFSLSLNVFDYILNQSLFSALILICFCVLSFETLKIYSVFLEVFECEHLWRWFYFYFFFSPGKVLFYFRKFCKFSVWKKNYLLLVSFFLLLQVKDACWIIMCSWRRSWLTLKYFS